jgi:hypothetical protein
MMKHNEIDTGMLRSYLDGEAGAGKGSAVADHVAACDACQAELKELHGHAASTGAAFGDLPHAAAINTAAAWTRLQARMKEEAPRPVLWTPMRKWWVAAAGLLATAALLITAVAPIRAWAENLLSIFRVEHVAVVDINAGTLKGLEGDTAFNQAMGRFISEEVTVTQPPQKPQQVADAATASKLAGFEARLIAGETPSTLIVRNTITAQMKLDRDRLQSIIDEAGRTDLRIPSSVDGAVIGMRIPAGIMAFYGNCGDVAARMAGANPPEGAARPEEASCVKLNELPSPTASVPSELNPAELAQVALQFAGLSPTEAANFTQTVDWTTTFVLPILHGEASYEKVHVNGNDAVLLRAKMRAPEHYVLVWVEDGILYNLMGTGDNTTALNLASRIE